MCYSAMVWADYKKYVKRFGATVSLRDFAELYFNDVGGQRKRARTPKAMDATFAVSTSADKKTIRDAIARRSAEETRELERELFKQTRRHADASRTLNRKVTKKAQDDLRISAAKVGRIKTRIADLKRSELKPDDARIYPGSFVPVMMVEDGKRILKPMRYQCRIAGVPADFDRKYPGTYNARRDSLGGFWRKQFAQSHAVVVASAFYEHVERDGKNVILEFRPQDHEEMLVACLWSQWLGDAGEQLLSFAAITDEPPPEVAAAGHDRCIIPIKPEHLDAWLNPQGDAQAMQAILNDRQRHYYEHRLAA